MSALSGTSITDLLLLKKGPPLMLDTSTRQWLVSTATLDGEHRQKPFTEIAEICRVNACERALKTALTKKVMASGLHVRSFSRPKQKRNYNLLLPTDIGRRRIGDGLSGQMSAMFSLGEYGARFGSHGDQEKTTLKTASFQNSRNRSLIIWGGIVGGKRLLLSEIRKIGAPSLQQPTSTMSFSLPFGLSGTRKARHKVRHFGSWRMEHLLIEQTSHNSVKTSTECLL